MKDEFKGTVPFWCDPGAFHPFAGLFESKPAPIKSDIGCGVDYNVPPGYGSGSEFDGKGNYRIRYYPAVIENGKKRFSADRVEVITTDSGHCDIDYAWWSLIVKGMHRVICNIVHVGDREFVKFSDRSLKLCG